MIPQAYSTLGKNARVFVWGWGRLAHTEKEQAALAPCNPKLVEALETSSLRRIACGNHHTAAIANSGALYVWGQGIHPHLPKDQSFGIADGSDSENIAFVSCGRKNILAVTATGSLLQWDCSRTSRPGSAAASSRATSPVSATISPSHSASGPSSSEEAKTPRRDNGAGDLSVSRGGSSSSVVVVSAAGSDTQSLPETPSRSSDAAGGSNGLPSDSVRNSPMKPHIPNLPVIIQVSTGIATHHSISRVSCGAGFVIAISTTGKAFSWGRGSHGRLGHGHTQDVSKPTLIEALQDKVVSRAACGWTHAAVVVDPGHVYTWGCSLSGRLGHGIQPHSAQQPHRKSCDLGVPTVVTTLLQTLVMDVSCGYHHSLALDVTGMAHAWGGNEKGQLGLGDTEQRDRPVAIVALRDEHIVSVACGAYHSAAVTAMGEVYTWGHGSHGQLGVGDYEDRHTPAVVEALSGMDVSLVACGGEYTMAVSDHFMVVQQDYFEQDEAARGRGSTPRLSDADSLVGLGHRIGAAPDDLSLHSVERKLSAVTADDSDGSPDLFPSALSIGRSNSTPGAALPQTLHVPSYRDRLPAMRRPSTRAAPPLISVTEAQPGSNADSSPSSDSGKRPSFLAMIAKVFSKKDELPPEPEPAPDQDSGPVYIPKPRNPAEVSVNLRPGNLPPKSEAEAVKHNSELSRMNQLYRQKLQKEAKAKALRRQKDIERQEEENKQREQKRKLDLAREQRLEEATQEWLRDIVPNWENKRYASRARDLVWKMGIPPQVRGKIWPMCIGNALMITQELYGIFAQHANNARTVKRKLEQEMKKEQSNTSSVASRRRGGRSSSHAQSTHRADDTSPNGSPRPSTDADSSSLSSEVQSSRGESLTEDDDSAAEMPAAAPVILGKESTFSYIDVDLSRTFPTLAFFQEDCAMHRHLRDVLETFCFYRPDIGYVQGMSYLAGNLLLYMDPYAAFVCFANLLNSPFFHVFLKLDVERMNARYEVYNQIFKEHLPKLYRHFEENGVTPDLYFMEWCMTLFTKRLALDVVGRIWDCYLVFGEAFVYRTAVGILSALESKLLEQPFEQILKSLTTLPQNVGEKEMFDHIAPIKLSQSMKEKLANIERMRKK